MSERQKIQRDKSLIFEIKSLSNGASVHKINSLIAIYENWIYLHNFAIDCNASDEKLLDRLNDVIKSRENIENEIIRLRARRS